MKLPNNRMITLARESRQMTQNALSKESGVVQGTLSKIESGVLVCPEDTLGKLARILDYPPRFFYQDADLHGIGTGAHHGLYRRKSSVPVKMLKQIEAEVNIRRMHLASLLSSVDMESSRSIPRIDISEYDDDTAQVARNVRIFWNLPSGPVDNITALLESAGAIVIEHDFGTEKIDATSIRREGLPPLIFIRSSLSGDRLRFTLAHELGHLVMHDLPHPKIEDEADQFAAEFLMPAKEIGPLLGRLDLTRAAKLKPYWKVSMAAIIYRAHAIGRLTDNQYRYLFYQLSAAGYRTEEPKSLDIPKERPTTNKDLLEYFRKDLGYSRQDLMSLFCTNSRDFDRLYEECKPIPHLRAIR